MIDKEQVGGLRYLRKSHVQLNCIDMERVGNLPLSFFGACSLELTGDRKPLFGILVWHGWCGHLSDVAISQNSGLVSMWGLDGDRTVACSGHRCYGFGPHFAC